MAELYLENVPLQSLHSFPADIRELQLLSIHDAPELRSVAGLPNPFSDVTNLFLVQTGIQTLEGFPALPNIERIGIKHGNIPNLAGVEDLLEHLPGDYALKLDYHPIISPYGISPDNEYWLRFAEREIRFMYRREQAYYRDPWPDEIPPPMLPRSYLPKLGVENFEETTWTHKSALTGIRACLPHFATDPTELAVRYSNEEELSAFEQDRILLEGTLTTLSALIDRKGIHDPLTQKLAARWQVPLQQGDFMI